MTSTQSQSEKAQLFSELHVKGAPLTLYNIWDAGGAKAIADAGAKAVATGSWSVAAAQGYADGEAIPLDFLLMIAERIASTVDLPLSLDFEGGYAAEPQLLAKNITRLIEAGAVGLNFEDQVVGDEGLYDIEIQQGRIKAIRQAADNSGVPLVINARTDLFLKERDRDQHAGLVKQAIERAAAYRDAGASCFFIPGLVDRQLIRAVIDAVSLPVNVMMMSGSPAVADLASLGVARISYGPGPYASSMATLAKTYQEI